MNSLFFDKWGDKFSTDSSVFSTNVSRVLQGWEEGDNFAAEKGISGKKRWNERLTNTGDKGEAERVVFRDASIFLRAERNTRAKRSPDGMRCPVKPGMTVGG